jgi:hypothetical protein
LHKHNCICPCSNKPYDKSTDDSDSEDEAEAEAEAGADYDYEVLTRWESHYKLS